MPPKEKQVESSDLTEKEEAQTETSMPAEQVIPGIPSLVIADKGIKSALQLYRFFMDSSPGLDPERILAMAELYITEAAAENINSDIAFVQMCLETGFLHFGGLVTEDMNNFCGLGAINAAQPGERFATVELGVRAHIQHLQAYGRTDPLTQSLVDPRYKWVQPRGKAPTVYELAGTWAADRLYGEKLAGLLQRLANY
jgi:hypothetical protein